MLRSENRARIALAFQISGTVFLPAAVAIGAEISTVPVFCKFEGDQLAAFLVTGPVDVVSLHVLKNYILCEKTAVPKDNQAA